MKTNIQQLQYLLDQLDPRMNKTTQYQQFWNGKIINISTNNMVMFCVVQFVCLFLSFSSILLSYSRRDTIQRKVPVVFYMKQIFDAQNGEN